MLLSLVSACGPLGSGTPTIVAHTPAEAATDTARNASISATFSEEMDPASLSATTFTLFAAEEAEPVAGTVITTDSTTVFWPAAHLASDVSYTATITTGAKSVLGGALEADRSWTFTTGDDLEPGQPVNLGAAGDFAILAKSGISTVPPSAVTGDIAVSPAAASYVTGFSLTADASNVFSTSTQVTGNVYAADYASPTPADLTTAVHDMELAFVDAAGRAPDFTEHNAGDIGGMTLGAGVYKWGTGLLIPTDVTLDGSADDVWIFQIAQDLTMSSATRIVLTGGALPHNIFWQVSGQVQVGTTSHMEGIVLSQTSITLGTGASVNGRLLAQTSVDIDGSAIVEPAQ